MREPSTPVRAIEKPPRTPDESKPFRSLPNNSRVTIARTSSAPVSALRQQLDPPNSVRTEPTPRMSQPAKTTETPRPSSSETEAWRTMVQVLRETLDRQEKLIKKLERENEELRSENKELDREQVEMHSKNKKLERENGELQSENKSLRQDALAIADQFERLNVAKVNQNTKVVPKRPPSPSDDSISIIERRMEKIGIDEPSVQSDDWSLPHHLFIRRESPDMRGYPDPKRGRTRSQSSVHAFSPPVPEMGRSERPPSPVRSRIPVDEYGYPIHGARTTASMDPRYFAPISSHAFSPGTKIVGDLSSMMHVKPDHLVPLSYMVDDYYGRRHVSDRRDARSEMRASSYR